MIIERFDHPLPENLITYCPLENAIIIGSWLSIAKHEALLINAKRYSWKSIFRINSLSRKGDRQWFFCGHQSTCASPNNSVNILWRHHEIVASKLSVGCHKHWHCECDRPASAALGLSLSFKVEHASKISIARVDYRHCLWLVYR